MLLNYILLVFMIIWLLDLIFILYIVMDLINLIYLTKSKKLRLSSHYDYLNFLSINAFIFVQVLEFYLEQL